MDFFRNNFGFSDLHSAVNQGRWKVLFAGQERWRHVPKLRGTDHDLSARHSSYWSCLLLYQPAKPGEAAAPSV